MCEPSHRCSDLSENFTSTKLFKILIQTIRVFFKKIDKKVTRTFNFKRYPPADVTPLDGTIS